MKINEVIVVEGKKDTLNLCRFFDVDTIETSGTGLSDNILILIAETQKKRGIIIFTDPDTPGDQIRARINQAVPNCKNAFLPSSKAKAKGKVGVEHANQEALMEALQHCVTYFEGPLTSLSWSDFCMLGLNGRENSSTLRNRIMEHFHLGEANAKTCFKRLNMLGIRSNQIQAVLENFYE